MRAQEQLDAAEEPEAIAHRFVQRARKRRRIETCPQEEHRDADALSLQVGRTKERFPNGWSPPRKISRDAMASLRQLHHMDPVSFTTEVLAERFRISPEAVRRILKSKWEPSKEKKEKILTKESEAKAERKARKEKVHEAFLSYQEKEKGKKQTRSRSRDRLTLT